jgi:PAS domain S-box-containing protein
MLPLRVRELLLLLALLTHATLFPQSIKAQTLDSINGDVDNSAGATAPTVVLLTDAEKVWLRDHPVITITADMPSPPYLLYNNQEESAGILQDITNRIGELLGVQFQFSGVEYSKLIELVSEGSVEVSTLNDPLDTPYQDHYLKTQDCLFLPYALFVKDNHALAQPGKQNMTGQTIVIGEGWDMDNPSLDVLQGNTIVMGESLLDCVNMVLNGEADGFFETLTNAEVFLKERFVQNIHSVKIYNEGYPVAFFIRKEWPELHSAMDKALGQITVNEKIQYHNKWSSILDNPAYNFLAMELTTEERQWLKAHPVIRVGCDPTWAPIEFLDDQGVYKGITIDYLNEIQPLLGVEFDYIRGTAQELMQAGNNREIDLFPSLTSTPERQKIYVFTEPYISIPLAIFTRDDIQYIGDLQELEGLTVAVVENYAIHELLKTDYPALFLLPVTDVPAALHTLRRGEADAVVENILTATYYIRQEGYTDIHVSGESPYVDANTMTVRNDWPILQTILQKALNTITDSRKNEIYRRWVTIQYEHSFDYSLFWKFGSVAFVLLGMFFLWNYKLKQTVDTRTIALRSAIAALRTSKERYRFLFNSGQDAIIVHGLTPDQHTGTILEVNDVASQMLGYTKDELLQLSPRDLDSPDRIPSSRPIMRQVLENKHALFEWEFTHKDGHQIPVEIHAHLIELEGQSVVFSIARDITERKNSEAQQQQLESQLERAQRLESIGRLAGGIAHDFNNILASILGHADLLKLQNQNPSKALKNSTNQIIEGVERAADLTQQLLGFARGGKYHPAPLNINDVITDTIKVSEKIFEKNVTVPCQFENDIHNIYADENQLHQVLLNLIINAKDAMPDGGSIHLTTQNTIVQESSIAQYPGLIPGSYVKVSIRDTGTGMDADVLKHIFEPFFTTKERSEGTGLGLAMVYGIVKNHQGNIYCESTPGEGTVFTLFFPATEMEIIETKQDEVEIRGHATVLVVDDESNIRTLMCQILESLGYHTISAVDGKQAVDLYQQHKETIDLVLLDMIMPNMAGSETYYALKDITPNIKVLLLSGFSEDHRAKELIEAGAAGFIQKPFRKHELSKVINDTLTS